MNYIPLKRRLPSRYASFLFADDKNCSTDSIFFKNRLYVKIGDVAKRDGDKYQLVFCRVHKNNVKTFEKAMKDLADKMYIIGNRDYDKFCTDIFSELTGE